MLKLYQFNGATFQFEEGQQPKGAVEVKPKKAPNKKAPAKKTKESR